MILDIYKTTVCKGYNLDKIYKEIKTDLINRYRLADLEVEGREITGIKLLTIEDKNIPSFTHPIILTGDKIVVIDVRRLVRINSENKEDYMVSMKPDFSLLVLRARTLYFGVTRHLDRLKDFDPLPAIIFARWITNALTFKFNLIDYEQNVLVVLSVAYYFKIFDPELNVIELMLFINRNTYIDSDNIIGILEGENGDNQINEKLKTLAGFIEVIKGKIGNVRIENLSIPILMSSLTYGWRGADAKEVMAVCLEHPPTWIACLATAIKDKNYKHSPIAKIVKNYTKSGKDKDFLLRLDTLLVEHEREF